ncbi:MAG: ABC-F family ATP-binding cassette domain-containing protein [Prolixibacteraceae bacterium]|nr:ABC-F family ATP-binding cassette domain-containing protein [Prolixibacteraceae bacterium]
MIALDKVTVSFGGFDLLKEVSFLINPDDRIGLIGRNGAGKTTVLKLIDGIMEPSGGQVSLPKDTTIGYLPQQLEIHDTNTLFGETVKAFKELTDIENTISELNNEIIRFTDFHSAEYMKKLDLLTEINERYSILGGDTYKAETEQTLTGLGFERTDFNRSTSEFSGGWRMRVELAKLLLKKPDVILLDEPTNHLDIESIQWLENFLKNYRGAVVIVSHDKAFLNSVCNRTIEISLGRVKDQRLNFSAFMKWKEEQTEIQLAAFRNQQKLIEDTEKFIDRFRYKATKAVQVQSRIKQLEKIDRIEIEEYEKADLKIHFPPVPQSGKIVVEAKNVSKRYGDHLVLDNINFLVERGDKVAFVGRNGEGKTTLVRIIIQQLKHEGSVKAGHNVRIGYFAQNQAEFLNDELTVLETIDEIAVGDARTKIRDILGAFLFSGEDVGKKVKVLSGGERSRLAMIRLMLTPVNLLVLDEPTNHFDMRTKEILKEALINFQGSVIIVSHDRDFLDGTVNCVYEFRNKKIKQHLGGIYDFLRKKNLESMRDYEASRDDSLKGKTVTAVQTDPGIGPGFEERKEINRTISRLEKRIFSIEELIGNLESEIKKMDRIMSLPEVINDMTVFEKYDNLKSELKKTFEKWEREHNELEFWKLKKSW